ncbi:MAG: hypothetical protein H0X45_07985 [Planctomycetes bacterium]|nr:hypothetical protein [Planctomycetota bacterium]
MRPDPRLHARSPVRRGALLIIVVGLAALIAGLCFSFLVRARSDSEAMAVVMREAQARIMLGAACAYVIEAGRIGWGRECFGWRDVRDGLTGPKPDLIGGDITPRLAIGAVARMPAYLMQRPPSAVHMGIANPIAVDEASPRFGMPYLSNPDPRPIAATIADFRAGDRRPLADTVGRAWIRVRRDDVDVFTVTCGSGATQGFQHWNEVVTTGHADEYGNDEVHFNQLRNDEARLWYRLQWSPAIASPELHNPYPVMHGIPWAPPPIGAIHVEHHVAFGMNSSQAKPSSETDCQGLQRNMGGTIRWIQRLHEAPADW